MDWGALLFILAIGVLGGLYVALPVIQRQGNMLTEEEHRRSALLARREQVLTTLAELEFDHDLGKVDEEHYRARRQALLQEGAEVLRELDALKGGGAAHGKEATETMEALLAAQRAKQVAASEPAADGGEDEVEALLAARRRARQAKSGGFCPQCGAPVLATDRFCPRCGSPLSRA